MKKQYEKPMLLVEDFLLSDYIAACAGEVTLSSDCGNPFDSMEDETWISMGLYLSSDGVCNFPVDEMDDGEFICYHNPNGAHMSFAS